MAAAAALSAEEGSIDAVAPPLCALVAVLTEATLPGESTELSMPDADRIDVGDMGSCADDDGVADTAALRSEAGDSGSVAWAVTVDDAALIDPPPPLLLPKLPPFLMCCFVRGDTSCCAAGLAGAAAAGAAAAAAEDVAAPVPLAPGGGGDGTSAGKDDIRLCESTQQARSDTPGGHARRVQHSTADQHKTSMHRHWGDNHAHEALRTEHSSQLSHTLAPASHAAPMVGDRVSDAVGGNANPPNP